jgi:hypothetical protein
VYVFGGQSGELETNKDADVYDPVADATKRVDVNDAMSEPTISNFYATMFVLPQGKLAVFNHNHAQVRCLFCFLICVAAVLTNAAITTRAHNTVRRRRATLHTHQRTRKKTTHRSSTLPLAPRSPPRRPRPTALCSSTCGKARSRSCARRRRCSPVSLRASSLSCLAATTLQTTRRRRRRAPTSQ